MRKILLGLSLLGVLSLPALSNSAKVTGIMASGSLVGGPVSVYQVAPSTPPIQVPIEKDAPWWKFWKRKEIEYRPAYPIVPMDQNSGGMAIIQPERPAADSTPKFILPQGESK
jgi:hypothetical protein